MPVTVTLFKIIDKVFYKPFNSHVRYPEVKLAAEDVIYDQNAPETCKLDIYKKDGIQGKLPVFFNIHGGGFTAGDKKYRVSYSEIIGNRGWAVVQINHGLCPEYVFPSFVQQAVKALNFIIDRADEYGLDSDKIVVSGDSAGAYMASMLLAICYDDNLRETLGCEKIKKDIFGGALFCGPYDAGAALSAKMPFNFGFRLGRDITGVNPFNLKTFKDYKYYNELSTINAANAKWPAMFVAHTHNDIFCNGQGDLMVKKLRDFGVPVREVIADKDMHVWHLAAHKPRAKACNEEAFRYLDDMLAGKVTADSQSTLIIPKRKEPYFKKLG